MIGPAAAAETHAVERWWNDHPFTYSNGEGVGHIDLRALDIAFFERVERKLREHGPTYQSAGQPLLSNWIDYASLRGRDVLDVACGTGVLTVEFARQQANVTAIDLTDYAVAAASKNLALRGLKGRVVKMDAQQMQFAPSSFAFVCAQGCLMHMPDTEAALREIHRVLRPGGRVHAWMYHKGWYYRFNIMLLRGVLGGQLLRHRFNTVRMTSRYSDGLSVGGNPHTKFYSRREVRSLFERAGFHDVKVDVVYNPLDIDNWPVRRFPLGKRLPRRLHEALGRRAGLGVRISAAR